MSANRRQIHQNWLARDLVHRILDAGCVLAGMAIGARLTLGPLTERQFAIGALAAILYFLTAEISGMYRNWRGVSVEREVTCAVFTWSFTWLFMMAAAFLTGYPHGLAAVALWAWFLVTPLLIGTGRVLIRWVMRMLRSRGVNTRRYAIVGINELAFQLVENIDNSPELGLKFLGFYDDRAAGRVPKIERDAGSKIGNLAELVEHARARRVDMVYITLPMRAEDRIRGILDELGDTTASVYIVPDFFVFELLHSRWTSISGLPIVSVFENPFYGIDGLVKRSLDVVLASLLLAATALPMLAIALLVKLTSPGPVLFRQKRYGLDGRQILVWKFRTMRVCEDGPQVTQATRNDPRLTPIGGFLRGASLDELPQLFNVLQGTMSLVGPRPHANTHNEEYRKLIDGYMLRHKVKPGITGLAQVSGWRGETDTLEKMQNRVACDHRYIREWSLWMDVKILLRTLLVVLSRRNAY